MISDEVLVTGVQIAASPPFYCIEFRPSPLIMEMVDLICIQCNKDFVREVKEHTRNLKLGRRPFCSLSCSAKYLNEHGETNPKGYTPNLKRGRDLDKYSPFRWHLLRVKGRKKFVSDLDLEYLKKLWEQQNGKCPYTQVCLKLPNTTGDRVSELDFASLDRIDSTKGYLKGNVQFVSLFINFAKNKFSRQQVEEFIKLIKSS